MGVCKLLHADNGHFLCALIYYDISSFLLLFRFNNVNDKIHARKQRVLIDFYCVCKSPFFLSPSSVIFFLLVRDKFK